jgi:hypothetical protein
VNGIHDAAVLPAKELAAAETANRIIVSLRPSVQD